MIIEDESNIGPGCRRNVGRYRECDRVSDEDTEYVARDLNSTPRTARVEPSQNQNTIDIAFLRWSLCARPTSSFVRTSNRLAPESNADELLTLPHERIDDEDDDDEDEYQEEEEPCASPVVVKDFRGISMIFVMNSCILTAFKCSSHDIILRPWTVQGFHMNIVIL